MDNLIDSNGNKFKLNGTHPLEEFWAIAYGEYAVALNDGIQYRIPGFSDPLLSATFFRNARKDFLESNHFQIEAFNEICAFDSIMTEPNGFVLRNKFILGTKKISQALCKNAVDKNFSFEQLPLKSAIQKKYFWDILASGFPTHISFLNILLPFLAELQNVRFLSLIASVCDIPVGVVTIGIAGKNALILNAAIHSNFRNKKYLAPIINSAKMFAVKNGVETAIFWTEHSFMKSFADTVHSYRIYEREK